MIVVTGASGLLGANLVCRAHSAGRAITALCHNHALKIVGVPVFSLDLTDAATTGKLLRDLRPNAIIHCAAATNVDWCEDHPEPATKLNAEIPAYVAEIAAQLDAAFICISTDAVFDGQRGNYSEQDHPSPVNVYARTKLDGETRVMDRNPHSIIARVTLYGWNAQDKHSLAEWMLHCLSAGKPVRGFTDVYFTPLLATDLADLLLAMLDQGLSGTYHLGGSQRISKYDFARLLAEEFGFKSERVTAARLSEGKLRAQRPPDTSMNSAKIKAALHRDLPDVISGIKRFHQQRENGYAEMLKHSIAGDRK